jgi:spore coat polysaccharide biosynthesis protein SpsF (cytidylyltransferase family)
MTTVAIIQARLGSTRLPRKVLKPLPTGRTVIEEVVCRARQIQGIDDVIVATPDDEGDEIGDVIFGSDKVGEGEHLPKVFVFQGPHHDVLKRYALAAEAFDADVIMRITADCPLIDPEVCSKVLRQFEAERKLFNGPLYVSNVHPRSYPTGWDCEVFDRAALTMADMYGPTRDSREHVTPYMLDSAIGVANVEDMQDRSHIRWTLDTPADYRAIWDEFERRGAALCV